MSITRKVCGFTLLVTALGASSSASLSQSQDTTVIERFISKQATKEGGEEYLDARKIIAGDLNRDGVADLAVLYTIEGQGGTNNHIQYLAVFVRSKSGLVPIAHTVAGGKSNRDVELQSIKNNVIFFQTLKYGPRDPSCCPSKKGTTRFVLSKGRLKEI